MSQEEAPQVKPRQVEKPRVGRSVAQVLGELKGYVGAILVIASGIGYWVGYRMLASFASELGVPLSALGLDFRQFVVVALPYTLVGLIGLIGFLVGGLLGTSFFPSVPLHWRIAGAAALIVGFLVALLITFAFSGDRGLGFLATASLLFIAFLVSGLLLTVLAGPLYKESNPLGTAFIVLAALAVIVLAQGFVVNLAHEKAEAFARALIADEETAIGSAGNDVQLVVSPSRVYVRGELAPSGPLPNCDRPSHNELVTLVSDAGGKAVIIDDACVWVTSSDGLTFVAPGQG